MTFSTRKRPARGRHALQSYDYHLGFKLLGEYSQSRAVRCASRPGKAFGPNAPASECLTRTYLYGECNLHVAALILSFYLAPVVGSLIANVWFGLKVASALPRFVIAQAYQRGIWRPDVNRASRIVQASLAIDGAIWGLVGIWGAGSQGETIAGLLLGCLSSVAMLATFGLQVQLRATAAFVLPIMVPMALALML